MKRAALWYCLAAAAWCQGDVELPLDQAVTIALRNNRLVKNAEMEVRKAEDEMALTRTFRLPKLSFYQSQLLTQADIVFPRGAFNVFLPIGAVIAQQAPITNPLRPVTLLTAQVSHPLSDLYRMGLGINVRKLGRDVARQKLQAQKQAVSNEVKKAYYAIVQTQSALGALEESIELYREVDAVAAERLAEQAAEKPENLEIKARLAKAESDAAILRQTRANQKEQMNELLGRHPRTEFRVAEIRAPAGLDTSLPAARARALAHRPEVREAHLQQQHAEYDRSLQRAEYLPDVSLTFSYMSPFRANLLPKHLGSAGLLVSWDPLNRRRRHELPAKSQSVEQARSGVSEAEAQVMADVDHSFGRLQQAKALLRAAERNREAAHEKLRATANRYQQKTALVKDVVQSEAGMAEADQQYRSGLLGYWTARAEFETAVGER